MKPYLSLLFVLCITLVCAAQQTSRIDFEIKNVGLTVDGHFNSFTITTQFDTTNTLNNLSGTLNVKSIETGIDSRDKHLLKADYFNVSAFPVITLKVITLKKTTTNTYNANVNLTIKGITKQLTLPLTVEILKDSRKITSQFTINRRDFDVGGRSFVMSNWVTISVKHIEKINETN